MQFFTESVKKLIEELSKLPSIGKKSAQRLAYHIIKQPADETEKLYSAIKSAKDRIRECRVCFNYTETDLCPVCQMKNRDRHLICVVEKPMDLLAIERGGYFKGVYHVLGGAISPLDGVNPENLKIRELLDRIDGPDYEVILSTSTGTEGDHTSLYLTKLLKEKKVRVTRIARGLPVGSDLEYMDEITLLRAMEGRVEL
jgi:recombination protein RecR